MILINEPGRISLGVTDIVNQLRATLQPNCQYRRQRLTDFGPEQVYKISL